MRVLSAQSTMNIARKGTRGKRRPRRTARRLPPSPGFHSLSSASSKPRRIFRILRHTRERQAAVGADAIPVCPRERSENRKESRTERPASSQTPPLNQYGGGSRRPRQIPSRAVGRYLEITSRPVCTSRPHTRRMK